MSFVLQPCQQCLVMNAGSIDCQPIQLSLAWPIGAYSVETSQCRLRSLGAVHWRLAGLTHAQLPAIFPLVNLTSTGYNRRRSLYLGQ